MDEGTDESTEGTEGTDASTAGLEVIGNADAFQLLCQISNEEEGWVRSTKAMELPEGCLVQVSTQQGDHVAEALQYIPGVYIVSDINNGRRLERC